MAKPVLDQFLDAIEDHPYESFVCQRDGDQVVIHFAQCEYRTTLHVAAGLADVIKATALEHSDERLKPWLFEIAEKVAEISVSGRN